MMSSALAVYGSFFLTTALSYALICLGLNLQWGQTGLFNVGVAGFVGIGAYASALLTTPATDAHWGGFGLPIAAGWIGAMGIAGAASALIGIATLRLRADYLAITTFGVAVTIHLVALNAQALTGGPYGIAFIPRPFGDLADRPLLFNGLNLALVAALLLPRAALARVVQDDDHAPGCSARARAATACKPSRWEARSWGWGARCRRISSASSRRTTTSPA